MNPRVLYIASGGIEEPLIVSQVIRYLKRLRLQDDVQVFHLLTLERDSPENAAQIKSELAAAGIYWHGLTARPGKRVINLWREIWAGYREGLRLIRQHKLNLIHARSFIPGNIGLRLARKTNAQLVFDMRGFWALEKLAKQTIRSNWVFKTAQAMEDRVMQEASSLVSLTHAGQQKLSAAGIRTPIQVIPCCVDTDLFCPANDRADLRNVAEGVRFISVGSLGPGYLPESVFGLFREALRQDPHTRLRLLTRSDAQPLEHLANSMGCDWSQVDINSAAPGQVVDYLREADVGLCFIQPSPAKIASSPTKLAEYLACGLPVIANSDQIGDVEDIITQHRVGVLLNQFDEQGFAQAIEQIKELLADPELKSRCRRTAVEHFSVAVAVERYAKIYRDLLSQKTTRQ